jgi:hypothetical protein
VATKLSSAFTPRACPRCSSPISWPTASPKGWTTMRAARVTTAHTLWAPRPAVLLTACRRSLSRLRS